MAVVAFVAFGLFNFTGDPVSFMVGQDATAEEKAQLRADLGLDQPSVVQFVRFVGNAVQGEFGMSLRQGRSVATLLKERLPATIELSAAAAMLALCVGIPLGVYTALRRDSWLAQVLLAALARRREPADVPDRHPADPRVRRDSRLAAVASGGARPWRSAGGRPGSSPRAD